MKTQGILLLLIGAAAIPTAAQESDTIALHALLAEARVTSPAIRAAQRAAQAAAARVPQAGALPDPVLSAGLMNIAIADPRLAGDEMAMATVQIGQMLPARGVRSAREAMARAAFSAADQRAAEVERVVVARISSAYYELHFIDHATAVLTRNGALLEDFAEIARGRYAVGSSPQQDVLRAQTEITRLDEQLAALRSMRAAALAEINAALGAPPTRDFATAYPAPTRALAEAVPARGAFTAAAIGGGIGGGVPSLAELQASALESRPALLAGAHDVHRAREARTLAVRERYPDIEVMLGFGTQGASGMNRLSAMVAVPLPIHAARKQRQAVIEASHELTAVELDVQALANEIGADVAARYAEVVRVREQIVLLSDGVIPQAHATVSSATAAYQAGSIDFLSLLDAHATLFRNEIELGRRFADFGRAFAQLELAVGRDLMQEEQR